MIRSRRDLAGEAVTSSNTSEPMTSKQLQRDYIDEIRTLKPKLFEWWLNLTGIEHMNETPADEFLETWPFRVSGHPRLLEIFRRFYLRIEELNDAGTDGRSDPSELLIWDIQDEAPDIFKIVAGIVYVPVGLDNANQRA